MSKITETTRQASLVASGPAAVRAAATGKKPSVFSLSAFSFNK